MEEQVEQISRRVRDWRAQQGLSLHELATRSGVSASTIQKVEKGQMVPSVAVLLKIAHGLGRRPAELVGDSAEESEVVFVKSKHHPVISTSSRIRVERLSADLFDPAIEVWRLRVHPGYGSGKGTYGYEGEVVIICEDGEFIFEIAQEEYRLGVGDSLHFKAGIPHRWWNPGRTISTFTIAGNFPKGLRTLLHGQLERGGRSGRSQD